MSFTKQCELSNNSLSLHTMKIANQLSQILTFLQS